MDDLVSDVTTAVVPVSGHYLLHLGCDVINNSGVVWLSCNNRHGQSLVSTYCWNDFS